jgi:hypothetical protein
VGFEHCRVHLPRPAGRWADRDGPRKVDAV